MSDDKKQRQKRTTIYLDQETRVALAELTLELEKRDLPVPALTDMVNAALRAEIKRLRAKIPK